MLRVEGVNHKKRYVENANFPRQNKFIDNKWSNLYSDYVKEANIRSRIKWAEEGKKHPQNFFWDFSFHFVINVVIILQFQNI